VGVSGNQPRKVGLCDRVYTHVQVDGQRSFPVLGADAMSYFYTYVGWTPTDARSLERHGIPREFVTKSRVIIICNDWRTLNNNVAALQDRGHVLVFQPSAAELHRQAGEWFKDTEIYEWFGKNLHRMREPSFRYYVRAGELKAAGMDWKEALEIEEDNRRARLAAEILASGAYNSTGEMVRAFVQQGGGCRATFFSAPRGV
jgi:hypothetical protein